MKTNTNGTRVAQFLTIAQVLKGAKNNGLPVSRRTLDRYKAQGILRAYKLNGKIVFNVADIEKFIKNRSTGGNSAAAPVLIEEKEEPLVAEVQQLRNEVSRLSESVARIMTDKESQEFFDILKLPKSKWNNQIERKLLKAGVPPDQAAGIADNARKLTQEQSMEFLTNRRYKQRLS